MQIVDFRLMSARETSPNLKSTICILKSKACLGLRR
jgi:hypothetical protein